MIHLAPMIDNTNSLKHYMECTFLFVGISCLSDNYLKKTYLCSNYEWGILEKKHIYICLQFSKYENILCFIYNMQKNLLNYKIK